LAEIHGELWPLVDEIIEEPAKTLADLAIRARAMAVMHDDFWTSDVLSPNEYNLRALVDGICSLAGIEPLPGLDDLSTAMRADYGEGEEAEGEG
jgi:hypothetical protein